MRRAAYVIGMTELFTDTHAVSFRPTRKAGLEQLEHFAPRMGRHYAQNRNADLGPGERTNVSALSPWIRTRLVLEEEVARKALDGFSYASAEKFHQEICWRSYFKGWMEHRPSVWQAYLERRDEYLSALAGNAGLRKAYDEAVSGRTGIAGFDHWARELVETGYLHNHARMWFASIWIFTLKLPWELGADFFLKHLMDGDPASNTLSWRWVGGLHTRGKTYLARKDNIEKYTDGRFSPSGLAQDAPPLEGFENPSPRWPDLPAGKAEGRTGLLLTEEDMHLASLASGIDDLVAVAGCVFPDARSPSGAGEVARRFAQGALDDVLRRAMERMSLPARKLSADDFIQAAVEWALEAKMDTVATGYAPVGWVRPKLEELKNALSEHDIRLVQIVRDWDRLFWPYATKGFFPLKKNIPDVYAELGLPV